jgi:hypothetical protein
MQADKNGHQVLQVRSGRHDDDKIVLSIEDSDPGIDPKHAENIFDAFVTTRRSMRHANKNAGFLGRRGPGWYFDLGPMDYTPPVKSSQHLSQCELTRIHLFRFQFSVPVGNGGGMRADRKVAHRRI